MWHDPFRITVFRIRNKTLSDIAVLFQEVISLNQHRDLPFWQNDTKQIAKGGCPTVRAEGASEKIQPKCHLPNTMMTGLQKSN